jgi:hypothetical protein
MASDGFEMFTVYQNPSDYPGKFVVRSQIIRAGKVIPADSPLIVADTLAEARLAIPFGLYRSPRHPQDDPVIVEVWF